MKKKLLIATAVTSILLTTITVAALTNMLFFAPMTATIPAEIEIYIDGQKYVNGTMINWGNLTAGHNYTKTLDVKNNGGSTVTIQYIVTPPQNWTLTYSKNNTIVIPGTWLNGTLTLHVYENATAKTYYWDSYIKITG